MTDRHNYCKSGNIPESEGGQIHFSFVQLTQNDLLEPNCFTWSMPLLTPNHNFYEMWWSWRLTPTTIFMKSGGPGALPPPTIFRKFGGPGALTSTTIFMKFGGPGALTSTTIFKKCGVKASLGRLERYILKTHLKSYCHETL